ncbi:MAG: hypothetical protein ACR2FO_06495 [Actinomycetota bacterium]
MIEQLDGIIEDVRNAKTVRFSSAAMIDKESMLERLERIRHSAPEELGHARQVMSERDSLMRQIQSQTDSIVADAEAERDRLVSETEIIQAAQRQAQRVVQAAEHRASELRAGAEDYVDSRLASFEVVLHKTLAVVTKGRDSLKGRLDAGGQRVPGDEPGESADRGPDTTGNIQISRS